MRPWTIAAAVTALIAAAWWHFPAAAQRAATQPAVSESITFEQYRDFRLHDLAQRQARLARLWLYRERFDQIDANHDGKLDAQERAAWRDKQRENYRQQAAERARSAGGQH